MNPLREYIREFLNEREYSRIRGRETMDQFRARKEKGEARDADLMPSADSQSKKDPNQSIADAIKEYEKNGEAAKEALRGQRFGKVGMEYIKLFTFYSIFSIVSETGEDLGNIKAGINPAMVKADLANYPLLDKFDIFSGYLRILDNTLLSDISTAYKENVLKSADATKSVSSLQDINDFIPKYILKRFGVKVGKV